MTWEGEGGSRLIDQYAHECVVVVLISLVADPRNLVWGRGDWVE